MNNLDYSHAELRALITHHVGNKLRDEHILLSQDLSCVEADTMGYLLHYFLLTIKAEEVFSFTHSGELSMNEVFSEVLRIFEDPDCLIEASQCLAGLLYEQSTHPKVKAGEFHVVLFSNVSWDDQRVEAIGIFKSEHLMPFLIMRHVSSSYHIGHEQGFDLKGADIGCLVLRTGAESGFKVLMVDSASTSVEAQYWKNEFLNVAPVSNEYHQTQHFMGMAKEFVAQTLTEEFDLNKTDKIDLLNRSVSYFKNHDSFDKQEFEQEVFQDEQIIQSFHHFDENWCDRHDVDISDQFAISPQAVKKQARVFKSILKLDKNFHIYIHGRRELIEQGVDDRGRKFYKIYYENEA